MMCKMYSSDLRLFFCVVSFVLLFALPQCLADCGLMKPLKSNETAKEFELLKKIKPLIGKSFEVKDPVDPTKYTYKVSICGKMDGVKKPNVGALQIDANKTHILGLYNQTDIMGGTNLIPELNVRFSHTFWDWFEVKDPVDPTKYTYKVSICGKMDGVKKPNVGALQIDANKTHILGLYNQTDIMGGTDWMQLTYYGGENYGHQCNKTGRIAKIMIICDPDTEVGKFEVLEERTHISDDCFYLFEFGSRLACTIKPKPGLSSGSVFCILFFTAILSYLVLGVLYKRIVLGAQGLDQIPNYAFWRDFGNLQADGCDFICRFGSRQESQAYRGIDDHLKDEEERDDQLLNM